MSVADPGRWIRADPLDSTRDDDVCDDFVLLPVLFFGADGIRSMFETCSSVYSEIVERGFDDVVCFCWGDGHVEFRERRREICGGGDRFRGSISGGCM